MQVELTAEPVYRPGGRVVARLLAGVQIGTLAAGVILVFFAVAAWLDGQTAWRYPNLYAATFYGYRAARPDFLSSTLAGAGLIIVERVVAATMFSLITPASLGALRSLAWGVSFGLVWHWCTHFWLWKWADPLLLAYGSNGVFWTAGILLGFCLAMIPALQRSLLRDFLLK